MIFTDVSSERVVKAFKKAGFWIYKHRGAKHAGMTNGTRKITIPRHPRLNPFTLKGIVRDAGLTDEEFKELLNCGSRNRARRYCKSKALNRDV